MTLVISAGAATSGTFRFVTRCPQGSAGAEVRMREDNAANEPQNVPNSADFRQATAIDLAMVLIFNRMTGHHVPKNDVTHILLEQHDSLIVVFRQNGLWKPAPLQIIG